jgi:hypothetical protein
MLRRRKPRFIIRSRSKFLRRDPGDPAWMFIMERVAERATQRRPFRIYQGDFPWEMPPRMSDRDNTLLCACLREEAARRNLK